MSDADRRISLRDIALRAGVSIAAVSYALRGHRKIQPATRARILAVARELGYRPNSRVASLMAHIRGSNAQLPRESIAFVWVHTSRAEVRNNGFLRRVLEGAKERAQQLGFSLEEFWTDDAGMTDRRLQQIITARGITGVVLSPVLTAETEIKLDWDWSQFAAAVIGNVTWSPELPHAGHHHYLGMRTTLARLVPGGVQRPAAILERKTNQRAKRAWEASFLAHHPRQALARSHLFILDEASLPKLAAWLKALKPDAVIASSSQVFEQPALRAIVRDRRVTKATLHWDSETRPGTGGIDQCYDRIAAHAVDLMATQLNANEFGPPPLPAMMLFAGRWVAPASEIAIAPSANLR